jgi:lipopolysaccharide transport system ATP-binding protein
MAVVGDGIWKTFQIPHERRSTLFENVTNFFRPNSYETLTVLKDVSFTVENGDCVGIIGDNGSGKSTLLKIIAHILRPTRGSIEVKGKLTPFLELGIGFQPELTVRENITVYATIMGLTRRTIRDRIDEVISFAELEKFEDTKLKNLSSGMQVRLAFSTAIQTEPDILLVDEVLAVGDREFQKKCFDVFKRYKNEGVTIIFVSHDMTAVRNFCDSTMFLSNGELVDYGDTNQVIDRYIYKSADENAHQKADAGAKTEVVESSEKKAKWGDRNIEITDVKFINKNGNESRDLIYGDAFTVRIYYRSTEKTASPVFGIAFYNKDTYCYGTNTDIAGFNIDQVSGSGHIDFVVDSSPLMDGQFDVTVAAVSKDYKHTYDWHDRLYSFRVHNMFGEPGIFRISGHWQIHKGDLI